MKTDKHRCSATVPERDSRWPRFFQCSKSGTVQREGKWYCGTHDPERVKAKEQASRAAHDAERDEQDAIEAQAVALVKRIGAGKPYYEVSWRTAKGTNGYRRALILTFDEIEQLLKKKP